MVNSTSSAQDWIRKDQDPPEKRGDPTLSLIPLPDTTTIAPAATATNRMNERLTDEYAYLARHRNPPLPQDQESFNPSPEMLLLNLHRELSVREEGEESMHDIDSQPDKLNDRNHNNLSTIDWMRDLLRDTRRKRPRSLHGRLLDSLEPWILLTCIAVCVGLFAAWIDIVTSWLSDLKVGYCATEWYLSRRACCQTPIACSDWKEWSLLLFGRPHFYITNFFMYVLWSVICSTLADLIVRLSRSAAVGSGVAEVKTILGGFVMTDFLSLHTLLIKGASLPLAVGSGLAVGKEGPMIHLACCIGNAWPSLFPRYRRNEAKRREILSSAGSAGVAVAFGSPIGGVLFSLEELSTFFPTKTMIRSFYCALVSCVVLQSVNPFRGKLVLFQVESLRLWDVREVPYFLTLGLFGGIIGPFLIYAGTQMAWVRRRFSFIRELGTFEIFLLALGSAMFSYFNPLTRVDSGELLVYLFNDCSKDSSDSANRDFYGLCTLDRGQLTLTVLWAALLLKLILTVLTMGVKVPAGMFIPSMVIGGLFGRILGNMVILAGSLSRSTIQGAAGMYALLGAMSVLAGVTRLTLTLCVIMFELTGSLHSILPCMITVMTAKFIGDWISQAAGGRHGTGGLTEVQIRQRHYPFLDPALATFSSDDAGQPLKASDVMTRYEHLIILYCDNTITVREVKDMLDACGVSGFPVIRSETEPVLVGYITREDLLQALRGITEGKLDVFEGETFIHFNDDHLYTSRFSDPRKTENPTHLNAMPISDDPNTPPTAHSMDLSPYLDRAPLSVHPDASVDYLADLFSKLGPRYVIVKGLGARLMGLVTKKDLLEGLEFAASSLGRID